MGAALGQVGYISRLTAYRRAAGTDSFQGNAATQWGVEHEPVALQAYAAHTGYEVQETGMHQHPTLEWCAGSPDGLVGTDGMVEVKCPYYQQSKGPHQSVPPHYYLQMQQLLQCTGRNWCDYLCWCGHKGMSLFRVTRDDLLFEALLDDLCKFAHAVTTKQGRPPKMNKKKVTTLVQTSQAAHVEVVGKRLPCLLIT